MLPGGAKAWGLLDADIHDFWKVAEGLEDLGRRGRTAAGDPSHSEPPVPFGSLDPTNPYNPYS